ncbi:tetratricopeptide repeat-containing sulfotransferase family protein [Pseudoxanthomonas sp. CF125]|uniref:tetratricopeptide repeat-containing sulfotransferase family protein n=1 Tax=Pseudoxanthomonas sp. CF125 TaxID=1855303 RepID=UPI000891A5A3|nr:tetratricopeptide repeat-containing sulfotransferase family protein [Pseudoxanthomonas sp. CF125]SDQ63153.1 Tetratricopeptide repeat-containing protein [Pseudoxanthomonas sp. CF125]
MNTAAAPTATLETALAHASRLLATDPALAGEQATEIIKAVGDHPMALLVLGVSHRARGDIEGALKILQPLAISQPNSAMAQLELGIALSRARQGDEAVAALRRAVKLKPDLPQAWLALGDHFMAMDDAQGADVAYANHLRYSTRDPQLLAAANALHEQRIPEAEALLREHLKRAPTDVAAIRMLAEVAMRLGRNEDAENLLARCLELSPSFHAARQNYALALHRSNKPAEALAQIDQLLAHEPDNPGYRNLKAVVLCRIGDYEPAIALYQQILKVYPKHPRIWMSYGHALKTAGHQDRAIEAYRRSLQLEPGSGEVWWSLANLKTFRFSGDDRVVMQRELAKPDLASEHRQHLEFALGKALEDEGEYEASFLHYQHGNELRRATLAYSAKDTSARVARIKRGYTREFFEQRHGYGAIAADPIFIVGLPRAGSTLLEQILSSHSAVEGTMELPEITSITRELRGQGSAGHAMPYHDVLEAMGAEELRALGERYLQHTRIQRKTDAPFFIDKMPNNFLHIGLIQLMLPNAKIVDARRHPLACCFSGYKQHFARGQSFTYSLDDIGRYYADYVELMAHFDDALPGRVHRVFYEDMVDDTETQVRLLLEYCGLPFEDGCLRFFENKRAVRTASSEQVRKPIYREGVDHWRNYDPWLGPLKSALGPVLDSYPAVPEFPLAR